MRIWGLPGGIPLHCSPQALVSLFLITDSLSPNGGENGYQLPQVLRCLPLSHRRDCSGSSSVGRTLMVPTSVARTSRLSPVVEGGIWEGSKRSLGRARQLQWGPSRQERGECGGAVLRRRCWGNGIRGANNRFFNNSIYAIVLFSAMHWAFAPECWE